MDQNENQEQAQVQEAPPEQAPPAEPVEPAGPVDASKKLPAGICGILLGGLGIHKFVLGYTTEGIIMLAVSLGGGLITCGAASGVVGIIGLVEGIIYLTKTDQEFYETYVKNKKAWF
jgi:TM2 domain-containing membrane protein YozV